MTQRKIHTNTHIFFSNPHVLRIIYPRDPYLSADVTHRDIIRNTYKVMSGTWGYVVEPLPMFDSETYITKYSVAHFVFKDDIDALQFKLASKFEITRQSMWPTALRFTIHEVIG